MCENRDRKQLGFPEVVADYHDHKPVQHRDGKQPWCNHCGLTGNGNIPKSRLHADYEPGEPPTDLPFMPTFEKISYTPDHPRVEVSYTHPDGTMISMVIEVPDEIKPYYDPDMALNSAGYAVQRLIAQVASAKRNHEHASEVPNEVKGGPVNE